MFYKMKNEIAISVKHICKSYKLYDQPKDRLKEALNFFNKKYHHEYHALNDVCFTVNKGETVGILGKNGAGKSTLLKIITGVLTPSSGNVEVNGKISSLLELGAGFNAEYTGLENIYFQGALMGFTHDEMRNRCDEILSFADIGEFIHQPVKMYSSGMFARLAFSVAIHVSPDILIVDEALAVGDQAFQHKCMDRMHQMMQEGITILFVSHDINSVKRFCNKAIWILDGKIKLSGNVNEVTDRYLDFLKIADAPTSGSELKSNNDVQTQEQFNPNAVVTIKKLTIKDDCGHVVSRVSKYTPLFIDIEYEVFDDSIDSPVLGIALHSLDNKYICGLNTLLDKKEIPWVKGINCYRLEYTCGIRVLGGTYFFDCAIMEKTATIPFEYKARFREIVVAGEYEAEGVFVIPHEWSETP